MFSLVAQRHRTGRHTDDRMVPTADHTACSLTKYIRIDVTLSRWPAIDHDVISLNKVSANGRVNTKHLHAGAPMQQRTPVPDL